MHVPTPTSCVMCLSGLAGKIENISHPLLEVRPEKRILLLVVTADRGLCGGFNSNLLRAGVNFLRQQQDATVQLFTAGRKGRDFFRRRNLSLVGEYTNFFSKLDIAHARDIAQQLTEIYSKSEVDAVYIAYNEFKSVIQQRIVVEKLLPLGGADLKGTSVRCRLHFRATAPGDF